MAGYAIALDFTVATATVPGYAVGLEFEPGDPGTPPALLRAGGTLPLPAFGGAVAVQYRETAEIAAGGSLPALPAFGGAVAVRYQETATLTAGGTLPALPAFTGAAVVAYDSGVDRPEARRGASRFEQAAGLGQGARFAFAEAAAAARQVIEAAQQAARLGRPAGSNFQTAAPLARPVQARAQQAAPLGASGRYSWQTAAAFDRAVIAVVQQAEALAWAGRYSWQIARRVHRGFDSPYEQAGPRRGMGLRTPPVWPVPPGYAVRLEFAPHLSQPRAWDELHPSPFGSRAALADVLGLPTGSREQQGKTPPPSLTKPPPPWTGGGAEWPEEPEQPAATVTVPVLRVYIVTNELTLTLLDGTPVRADALTLSLDADSWTYSWSASLPGTEEGAITAALADEPVHLLASINGVQYRLVAESYTRERTFGSTRISVKGRGRSCMLDDPYASTEVRTQASTLTAQQLMAQALTINGVPSGWALDWQLTDWTVPAGSWSHSGTPIAAVLDIASAVSAMVQPHPTAQTLRILPRYRAAPWHWASLTPDVELPSAVVQVEGLEPVTYPGYNRIYLSGTGDGGVLGQVTRGGTAGEVVKSMATHALITHADAARQRGIAELAMAGRVATVTLSLPVLPATGLIWPGQMVRYVDGGTTHLGAVRSTAVQWSRPTLRQQITLETHPA